MKNWSIALLLKVLLSQARNFYVKLLYQKLVLKQIEWEVQKGAITKDGVLPPTTLVFEKLM